MVAEVTKSTHKTQADPLYNRIRHWCDRLTIDKIFEADGQLKAGITHKTRKENLKPRKPNRDRVQFIQGNLQKSDWANRAE